MSAEPIVTNGSEIPARHEHVGSFEYLKRLVVAKSGSDVTVAFMEIPPGKSGYPYHWHEAVTEVYVILAGTGTLRTPEGERPVQAGDVVILPAGPRGGHRLSNTGTETLRYVDIDTTSDPDVIHYPDSHKTGFISGGQPQGFFRDDARVGYYDGEPDAT